jgi:hypothetical protein
MSEPTPEDRPPNWEVLEAEAAYRNGSPLTERQQWLLGLLSDWYDDDL